MIILKEFMKYILRILPDDTYIRLRYFIAFKKFPNLKNPKSFNEKLQWIKLHDRKPLYTQLVDKYEVRKYISEKIGEEYIIPLLGVWDRPEDIDFDALPDKFVIKCNHNSGEGMVICTDKSKLDIPKIRKNLKKALRNNYFYQGREWPYKNVKPRIIAEKYMVDKTYGELRDYKLYCFDGITRAVLIATNRNSETEKLGFDYFDGDLNRLNWVDADVPNAKTIPEAPVNYDKMKELAYVLSKDIPHVRVDFYEANGKIYFGEMTFFDSSGFVKNSPEDWDHEIRDYLNVPFEKNPVINGDRL